MGVRMRVLSRVGKCEVYKEGLIAQCSDSHISANWVQGVGYITKGKNLHYVFRSIHTFNIKHTE